LARAERTIEDRLREEYFDLLPAIRRVAQQLEAEIRYHLLPISKKLNKYERLVVTSRVKDCESAVQKLHRGRGREGATFDSDHPERYSLRSLKDLAGVRVMAFPPSRLMEIDSTLRKIFHWKPDPIKQDGEMLAFKYHGYCKANRTVRGEYQIVSMLTGLFWEVEHSAMYKPDPRLRGVARHVEMNRCRKDVLHALRAFEEEFEDLLPAR
jgi:ppGpp synthetase/RelA/SpoT-type nucleotidyltranferase